MPEEKKNNLGQISDEALDALLAQWAEAEIAPPAGFHEKTMERLRSLETTEKKQNGKLISLFAGRKKWMSAAAAAVLVLCCIPVVQGQLGGTGDQPVIDTLPGQTTVVEQKAAEEATEAEVQQDVSVPNQAVTQAKQQAPQTTNTDTSANTNQVQEQPVQQPTAEDTVLDQNQQVQGVAAENTDTVASDADANAQPIAVYSMDEEQPVVSGVLQTTKTERGVTATAEQLQEDLTCYEDAIAVLTDNIETLQQKIAEYDAQLQNEPDNTELQKELDALKEELKVHQKEIENLEGLVEEVKEKLQQGDIAE